MPRTPTSPVWHDIELGPVAEAAKTNAPATEAAPPGWKAAARNMFPKGKRCRSFVLLAIGTTMILVIICGGGVSNTMLGDSILDKHEVGDEFYHVVLHGTALLFPCNVVLVFLLGWLQEAYVKGKGPMVMVGVGSVSAFTSSMFTASVGIIISPNIVLPGTYTAGYAAKAGMLGLAVLVGPVLGFIGAMLVIAVIAGLLYPLFKDPGTHF